MRQVTIKVHHIQNHSYPAPFPVNELTTLFRIFGIELNFDPVEDLNDDPATPQAYQAFIDGLPVQEAGDVGDPGHLILGVEWQGDGGGLVNGVLLEGMRGAVAIFTGSRLFKGSHDISADMLQVCAHEIGHLLNLRHEDGDRSVPTAECTSGDRHGPINSAWQRRGLTPPQGLKAYPFSITGEQHFNSPPENDPIVYPWGSYFNGGGILSDRADQSFTLSLRQELLKHEVGSHFPFEVVLTNKGSRKRQVCSQLDPRFQFVQLEITRPDGTCYTHRPRSFVCGAPRYDLLPGKRLVQPLVLLDGPGATIFPTAGTYSIKAFIPSLNIASRPLKIRVQPSRLGSYRRELSPFHFDRSPKTRKRFLACINRLLKKRKQLQRSYVAHLLFLKARRVRRPSQALSLLSSREFSDAPKAIQHRAALLRAQLLKHDSHWFQDCCRVSLLHLCSKDRDRHFHESLGYLGAPIISHEKG